MTANKQDKSFFVIPYQDKKGDFTIKCIKKQMWNILPNHVKSTLAYTSRKLISLKTRPNLNITMTSQKIVKFLALIIILTNYFYVYNKILENGPWNVRWKYQFCQN